MKKNTLKLISYFLLLTIFMVPLALGQNTDFFEKKSEEFEKKMEEKEKKFEEQKDKFMEKKQEFIQNRCDMITKIIDNRINRFNNNKDFHLKRYERIKERITNLIARLEDKGYDVSDLKDSLDELNEKILSSAALYEELISDLESAKDYECGASEGSFIEAVGFAKTSLKDFRESMLETRDFFKTEVKPELKELKDEIIKQKQERLKNEAGEDNSLN